MEIRELDIKGVFEINLSPISDNRGYFMRIYDENIFNSYSLCYKWIQENQSFTKHAGTIRGLHFQLQPFSEAKLVRCLKGRIYDVFVDLRKKSPYFSNWQGVELSEENKKMLLIPRGFAHGFCTLTENCDVFYKVDNYYSPSHERGIKWNDSELNILWPISDPILSDKDKKNMTFREFLLNCKSIEP